MTWMTLSLTVVALACGNNDPEEDRVISATEKNGEDNATATGKRPLECQRRCFLFPDMSAT